MMYNVAMDLLLPAGLILFLALIIVVLLWGKKGKSSQGQTSASPTSTEEAKGRPCPLCFSPLIPGERVHSVVYASAATDKIMEIHGCVYCYTSHPKGAKIKLQPRFCPVCKKQLSDDQVVTARVFPREGKDHIHVLGCPNCRKN
jgi:hypothetical protein